MASGTFTNAFSLLDPDADSTPRAPAKKEKKQPKAEAAPKEERNNNRGAVKERFEKGDRESRGGRGRGGGRGRKHDHDRSVSRNGKDKGSKRSGGGNYNWGSNEEVAKAGAAVAEGEAKPEGETKPAPEAKPEVEEEPEAPTMTLEEYQASVQTVKEDTDRKLRQVDNDDSNFKKAIVAKNEVDEADTYVIPGGAKKPKQKNRKKDRKMVSLDEFAKKNGGDNNRGGRGRGRGRGGERGRGGNRSSRNVNINDANAFPKLG